MGIDSVKTLQKVKLLHIIDNLQIFLRISFLRKFYSFPNLGFLKTDAKIKEEAKISPAEVHATPVNPISLKIQ